MKKIRHLLVLCALAALPAVTLPFAGCAGTSTRDSTGEYVDDSAITAKVKSSLLADRAISAFSVKVVTFKGVVQLSGFVNTAEQKQEAVSVASRVRGVRSVEDNITVKNS